MYLWFIHKKWGNIGWTQGPTTIGLPIVHVNRYYIHVNTVYEKSVLIFQLTIKLLFMAMEIALEACFSLPLTLLCSCILAKMHFLTSLTPHHSSSTFSNQNCSSHPVNFFHGMRK